MAYLCVDLTKANFMLNVDSMRLTNRAVAGPHAFYLVWWDTRLCISTRLVSQQTKTFKDNFGKVHKIYAGSHEV